MSIKTKTLEAIVRLENQPEWLEFLKQLGEDREEARDNAEQQVDEVAARRAQGVGIYLKDLLHSIANARTTLRR